MKNKKNKYQALLLIFILAGAIGFIIGLIANGLIITNTRGRNKNSANTVKIYNNNFEKFNHINKDGSFVLYSTNHKDFKIKKDFSKDKNVKHYDWYTDPTCGDCINAHSSTAKIIQQEILKGKLEIKFHPVNYLSRYLTNDYSLIGASYISGLAEYGSGNEVVYIMNGIYKDSVRDKFIKSTNLEKDFPKYLKDTVKINSNIVNKATKNKYKLRYAINQGSINLRKDKELTERSPKDDKSMYVPFIIDNDNKETKALITEDENVADNITGPLAGKTVASLSSISTCSTEGCQ